MDQWVPKPKNYTHFSLPLSVSKITAVVNSPEAVASHPFLPFLAYNKKWRRFKKGDKRKPKVRTIKFAASLDANIFSKYRFQLSQRYEEVLIRRELSECVTAYRKIPIIKGCPRGKCNIHFADEAFRLIADTGKCCAIALDISSFFESIDHGRLKAVWYELLGESRLPEDHYAVFKQLTKQPTIKRSSIYERLGFSQRDKKGVYRYLVNPLDIPQKLCTNDRFRREFEKKGDQKLIEQNEKDHGIPQGAPLSDLLANAYLTDFDAAMAAYAKKKKGHYRRYSDDILIIVPGDGRAGRAAREFAERLIRQQGEKLEFKREKTKLICFRPLGDHLSARSVENRKNKQGLDYLGFRFDGENIYIRDSTISHLQSKMRSASRRKAKELVRRYPGKTKEFLMDHHLHVFVQCFGRATELERFCDCKKWTFWSYAKKSANIFGKRGRRIYGQLSNMQGQVKRWLEEDIDRLLTAQRT